MIGAPTSGIPGTVTIASQMAQPMQTIKPSAPTMTATAQQPAPKAQVINAQSAGAYVPPTGLIGSEAALLGGASGAIGAITGGANQAIGGLNAMLSQIGSQSQQPVSPMPTVAAGSAANAPTVAGPNMSQINSAFGQADTALSGYNQGQGAMKLQADLSGANGPEAQAAAYAAYQSSPAMQYQMDQMQKATERSAAARGGLLSGNVLQELQRNAAGIASQDYQNQFNNLGQVAQSGLTAAAQQAQNKQAQASTIAGLEGQALAGRYSLAGQAMAGRNALTAADLQGRYSLAGQQMQNQASLQQQQNALKANLASQIADISAGTGLNLGGLYSQTGQQLSQGRTQAGQAIAQNATQAATNLSNILQNQGVQVSEMMGKDIASLTDMIYQSGMQDKVDMQNLAALLANITGGQATNVMQGQNTIGAAQAAGTIGQANAISQGLGMYLANQNQGAKTQ